MKLELNYIFKPLSEFMIMVNIFTLSLNVRDVRQIKLQCSNCELEIYTNDLYIIYKCS